MLQQGGTFWERHPEHHKILSWWMLKSPADWKWQCQFLEGGPCLLSIVDVILLVWKSLYYTRFIDEKSEANGKLNRFLKVTHLAANEARIQMQVSLAPKFCALPTYWASLQRSDLAVYSPGLAEFEGFLGYFRRYCSNLFCCCQPETKLDISKSEWELDKMLLCYCFVSNP